MRRAAEAGDAEAQFNMGLLASGSLRQPARMADRRPSWFRQGRRIRAIPAAQYRLGVLYLEGNGRRPGMP
ncbi:MAG: hypothetical protein V9G14_11230 [Cypionkella sp.]